MSCTFEFGVAPLPLKMDIDLLNTRCNDLGSGISSDSDLPLKTLSASCKRMKTECSGSSSSSSSSRMESLSHSHSCLGSTTGADDTIGHNF